MGVRVADESKEELSEGSPEQVVVPSEKPAEPAQLPESERQCAKDEPEVRLSDDVSDQDLDAKEPESEGLVEHVCKDEAEHICKDEVGCQEATPACEKKDEEVSEEIIKPAKRSEPDCEADAPHAKDMDVEINKLEAAARMEA